MKHLVTLLVVLGIAAAANAALVHEDFNGAMAGWTNNMLVQSTDQGMSLRGDESEPFVRASTALSSSVSSGSIYVEVDLKQASVGYRSSVMALYDATGKGIVLSLDSDGNNSYIGSGACATTNSGVSQFERSTHDNTVSGFGGDMTVNPLVWVTVRYDINLDTGDISASINGGPAVKSGNASSILSGMGAITTFAIGNHKNVYLDNVVVDIPEPASMALLGMGGLGMLIRRKRK